jgi:translation initiation factor 3 subunit K
MSSAIVNLLETAPYEPQTAASLAEYLNWQLAGTSAYDFAANKTLLRNYQLNTSEADGDVAANVLILALMQMPSTDFLALKYLIPAKLASNERIIAIKKCADLLERAQYADFWAEVAASSAAFSPVKTFDEGIKKVIVSNLRESCKSLSVSYFQQYLNLDESAVAAFCGKFDFLEVSGDLVLFTAEPHKVQTKALEGSIRVDEVMRLVSTLRTAK